VGILVPERAKQSLKIMIKGKTIPTVMVNYKILFNFKKAFYGINKALLLAH
jgi:hypothetical protein